MVEMLVVQPKGPVLGSLASEPDALWCSFHSSTSSSLTASVRPRAEKDPENTKGQAVRDRGHRLPSWGSLGVKRLPGLFHA